MIARRSRVRRQHLLQSTRARALFSFRMRSFRFVLSSR
jgi:hypothetical protein